MKYLEKEEEFNKIINSNNKVLVDFYANWCGPCKMLSPIIESVSKNHSDIVFLKVDVDKFENIARNYSIMSIPSLKLFENGKIIKDSLGLISKEELEDLLK